MTHFVFVFVAATLLLHAVVADAPTTLFHYVDNAGATVGPVPVDDIRVAYYNGVLTRESQVFKQGESAWKAFSHFPDLIDAFDRDRPYDTRSPLLMNVERFISEANNIPYDADQLEYEKLFCSRKGAFEAILHKKKLRKMVTDMVPELKLLLDEVRELGEQQKEAMTDLKMTGAELNKTLEAYLDDIDGIQTLLSQESLVLENMRSVAVTIRMWTLIKSVILDAVLVWERIIGVPIFHFFTKVRGIYVFVAIIAFFFFLSRLVSTPTKRSPVDSRKKRN